VDLSIECPLSPLLAYSIAHDHLRNVAVHALVRLIGPGLQHFYGDDLHVKHLEVVIESWHVAHEDIAPSPRALGILRKHLPHFVEPPLGVQSHEAHLECRRRDRRWRRWLERF